MMTMCTLFLPGPDQCLITAARMSPGLLRQPDFVIFMFVRALMWLVRPRCWCRCRHADQRSRFLTVPDGAGWLVGEAEQVVDLAASQRGHAAVSNQGSHRDGRPAFSMDEMPEHTGPVGDRAINESYFANGYQGFGT
jgi:hypothetical protein